MPTGESIRKSMCKTPRERLFVEYLVLEDISHVAEYKVTTSAFTQMQRRSMSWQLVKVFANACAKDDVNSLSYADEINKCSLVCLQCKDVS